MSPGRPRAFDPDAARQTADRDYQYLEYSAPPGEDLVITSDTRVEPDRQHIVTADHEPRSRTIRFGVDRPLGHARHRTGARRTERGARVPVPAALVAIG